MTMKNQLPKDNGKVEVKRIMNTSYGDGTSWIEYKTLLGLGYELSSDYEEGQEELVKIDSEKCINKKSIHQCSKYLGEIIENCRQSDNDMWFVEWEDLQEDIGEDEEVLDKFLEELSSEVKGLGLSDYVKVYEDECAVAVYGGVITQFLF